jgi:formate-dependent nitrite reductase membrane component NrfD
MKQLTHRFGYKTFLTLFVVVFFQVISWAQDTKVEVTTTNDVGDWFTRNWLWVVGIVVLLIIILLVSGGSSRSSRSKTTTYRRGDGSVTKTTTSESDIDS